MAVFTFVCRHDGESWSAKQHPGDGGLEGSASSPFDLQRQLIKLAISCGGSGAVSSSFSYITPSSAVYQEFESWPCNHDYFCMRMGSRTLILHHQKKIMAILTEV